MSGGARTVSSTVVPPCWAMGLGHYATVYDLQVTSTHLEEALLGSRALIWATWVFLLTYGFKEVTASLGLCLILWGPTFLSPCDSGQYTPDEVLSEHLGWQPAGRLSLFTWKQMIEILRQGG